MIGGFRVESLIGRGGMASVYRANQTRLDRPVALKVLNAAMAMDEGLFERFKLEGVNAARLEHPNIVPVYEAGEDAGFAFLAMKFVDGETFSSVISRERPMRPADVLRVLTDVARALDYAHNMGFVHRDVKPGNVLIDRAGHVYLADFGLSKNMRSTGLTSTGQWMGTAEYIAPEQAAGRADHRADLYALGCVAYECLTGDPPYLADTAIAVMMAHVNADIPRASARNPQIRGAVDDVLTRAMAKEPAARYPAALAFVESLGAAVEGRALTKFAEPEDGYRLYSGHAVAPESTSQAPQEPVIVNIPTSAPPTQQDLFCTACLGPLERDDVFCGTCGTRLLWCTSCGGPRAESDRFCQHCGATTTPPR